MELNIVDWDALIKKSPSIDELINITYQYIGRWTNRSLCAPGYSEEALREYDIFFGKMLKWAEGEIKKTDSPYFEFIELWSYRGKIYRLQGKKCVFRKDSEEPYLRRCGLKFHNMVASWSKTYEFDKFNKVYHDTEYLFIEGNTGNRLGFDVTKFCFLIGAEDVLFRLNHEQEIIFPITKKYIERKEYAICKEYIKQMQEGKK